MTTTELTVHFETRSAKALPAVGTVRSLRVNGHVERMRVSAVEVKENWVWYANHDGQYPIYRGTIQYEMAC